MASFRLTRSVLAFLVCVGTLYAVPPGHAQSTSWDSTSAYAPARLLAFADYLSAQGDHGRAVSEYQRYLFGPAPPEAAYAHVQLGRSLLHLEDAPLAASHFLAAAHVAERPAQQDSALVAYARALLAWGRDDRVFQVADTQAVHTDEAREALRHLAALARLRRGAWPEARAALGPVHAEGLASTDPAAAPLLRLIDARQRMDLKSPAVAGLLSTLLPGAGKLYAGRPIDGLYSLLLVGGSAWLAYDGFSENGLSSTKGWIFGTAGAVLYAGNIYGSVVAARLTNAARLNDFQHDVQAQISLRVRL